MKITILGCGTSTGVPLIGNNWGDCDPDNPRNHRLRASILVETETTSVLVDTSPDMRQQLLQHQVRKIDAVLYTHAHADHCHGIDDLRTVNWMLQRPVDIYADKETLGELRTRFPYILAAPGSTSFSKPAVIPHEITGAFSVGDLTILPIVQQHGSIPSLGFRFGAFAYSTDVHQLDDAAFAALRGTSIWVVDCVRKEPHPTHAHLERTLHWIDRVKPEQAYLTHMNHTMDYESLKNSLPQGVEPAYDGLVITC